MPTASDEQQAPIIARFGGLDDGPVLHYLAECGWTYTREHTFTHPLFTDLSQIPTDQWECIVFLRHEWDYGVPVFK